MEFQLTEEQRRRQQNARRRPQQPTEVVNEFGKLQPQNIDLENAVLGALMLEGDAFSKVSDILKPECFYEPANQRIFEAIVSLNAVSKPIDMLTVTEELRNHNTLDEAGGPMRISQLTSNVSSAANIEFHARIVAQKYLARELISFSSQIQSLAFDDSIDILDVLNEAEGKLFTLTQSNLKKDVTKIDSVITEALHNIETAANRADGLSGLPTGFKDIDAMTSGWQNSDLVIIAARPAMGKTAFVLSMALRMAVKQNVAVAVFSLEMSNLQLVNRLISNICEISGSKIKSGTLTNLEWNQLNTRITPLYSAPLYIDDTPSLSVFELRTKARRLVSEQHVQMIIIDYLQLMNASGMKFGSREQEVSTISRSLKQLAKELNIPIIALSQLNRSVENRTDGKVPQLSDLRESGAIEQDADMVCFIHRPEYYFKSGVDPEGNDVRGVAKFIFAKHRSGAIGDVDLRFRGEFARFEDKDESMLTNDHGIVASKLNASTDSNAPAPESPQFTGGISEDHFLSGQNDNPNF